MPVIPLPGTVKTAPAGLRGFDIDQVLSPVQAQAFKTAGYDFCIRYIPRTEYLATHTHTNLTHAEGLAILNSGLGLSVVQHTDNEGWAPTAALGNAYGSYAVTYASLVAGLPKGINIWCDLEVVKPGTTAADVIAYCQAWYNAVIPSGYIPGLYVGYGIVLTDEQLYNNLSFKHYWRAYNAERDVATRGYQVKQRDALKLNTITPAPNEDTFDPNFTQNDNLGGAALWLAL